MMLVGQGEGAGGRARRIFEEYAYAPARPLPLASSRVSSRKTRWLHNHPAIDESTAHIGKILLALITQAPARSLSFSEILHTEKCPLP
jgi:hypothetical protein